MKITNTIGMVLKAKGDISNFVAQAGCSASV